MITLFWTILTLLAYPFLAPFARKRKQVHSKKFLIVALGKIGDTVATTPLCRAIQEHIPDAVIHVMCLHSSAVALANNPYITTLHTLSSTTNRWKMKKMLRKEHFDVTISTLPTSLGARIGLWVLAPVRINTTSRIHGTLIPLLSCVNTENVLYGIHMNTFTHYMTLVQKAGIPAIPYKLDFFPSEEQEENANHWMHEHKLHKHGYVVLNLTAGNAVKEWPPEKFAKLATYITGTLKKQVVLSTKDHTVVKETLKHIGENAHVVDASSLSLGEVACVYRDSAAFVSGDTGPMYIARAMECPIVVMVGPVDPAEQLPPETSKVVHVPPPPGCTPWVFIASTPRTGTPEQLRSARDTSVESVIEGLNKVLA
jgi:ADP-heptose:LPS heptosyltransferase